MSRICEVCANHRAFGLAGEPPVALGRNRVRLVLVERRILALCEHHARLLVEAEAATLSAVQALFREAQGHRSLETRRAPHDRRVFPPRHEGRRLTAGRRAGDARG